MIPNNCYEMLRRIHNTPVDILVNSDSIPLLFGLSSFYLDEEQQTIKRADKYLDLNMHVFYSLKEKDWTEISHLYYLQGMRTYIYLQVFSKLYKNYLSQSNNLLNLKVQI